MMKPTILFLLLAYTSFSQTRLSIRGNVFDFKTKEPLSFATIGIKGKVPETVSASNGSFELIVPKKFFEDTLIVTYLGYVSFQKKISSLQEVENIYLEQSFTLLEEVVVVHAKLNVRNVDKELRSLRGNLYAMETEVTNAQYNIFLASLEEQNKKELRKKSDYDLSKYDQATQAFFKTYVSQFRERGQNKDSTRNPHIGPRNWGDYPAVNISHEGAQQYCDWLTAEYNAHTGKKKYKKVKFRLPTLPEWQIAALGNPKFQSWNLEENMVDVIISNDSLSMAPKKGVRKSIPVNKDVLYPWYGSYYYRRNPRNHMGCFLGNFKITFVEEPCPAKNPAYDGWSMMGRTASYFPNDLGLYDVVGNVAEMIEENGKACGGSWDDTPDASTIHSVKKYARPDATIGFRVFMEVVE